MSRDITCNFINEESSLFCPVMVYDGNITDFQSIKPDTAIFILNPDKLNQANFDLIINKNVIIILVNNSEKEINETDALKLLLSDKKADENLLRIKSLQKSILELFVIKNNVWSIFNLSLLYKQLFSVRSIGFCFTEYPVITRETLFLDDIFLKDFSKSEHPAAIIEKYIEYIEQDADTPTEAINRKNAFTKVFPFYKTGGKKLEFNLDEQDVMFLVDVLKLHEISTDILRCAKLIGALSAICAYFVHSGKCIPYIKLIEKITCLSKRQDLKYELQYTYVPGELLSKLQNENTFLYYQLCCRIPNQYCIALFDMIFSNGIYNETLITRFNDYRCYMEQQVNYLLLRKNDIIWQFKRDREVCALSGSLGQLTLYYDICLHQNYQMYDKAENHILKSIEYAHPKEKTRNYNYLISLNLNRILQTTDILLKRDITEKLLYLAKIAANTIITSKKYSPFDIKSAAEIIAVSNLVCDDKESVNNVFRAINFNLTKLNDLIMNNETIYASYLIVCYMLLFPQNLLSEIPDFNNLRYKSRCFFNLCKASQKKQDIMDLISIKFILADTYYITSNNIENEYRFIDNYISFIKKLVLPDTLNRGINEFMSNSKIANPALDSVLKLIYKIPY